jgi:hypothetical protein
MEDSEIRDAVGQNVILIGLRMCEWYSLRTLWKPRFESFAHNFSWIETNSRPCLTFGSNVRLTPHCVQTVFAYF